MPQRLQLRLGLLLPLILDVWLLVLEVVVGNLQWHLLQHRFLHLNQHAFQRWMVLEEVVVVGVVVVVERQQARRHHYQLQAGAALTRLRARPILWKDRRLPRLCNRLLYPSLYIRLVGPSLLLLHRVLNT